MALATYSDLQTQIANWLARDDLTTYIPDFISLFECAAQRKLKVRSQETTTTVATTNGIGTLPSDFLGYRDVSWNGTFIKPLRYVTPVIFNSEWPSNDAGNPVIFTIQGSSIKIKPLDDSGLTIDYFQRTPALSTALNWLYTNHFDAYLFGSLVEANAFNQGKAFDNASLWKQRRDEVFQEIGMLDFNERQNMTVRVDGYTP